jgi:hypothetical protein
MTDFVDRLSHSSKRSNCSACFPEKVAVPTTADVIKSIKKKKKRKKKPAASAPDYTTLFSDVLQAVDKKKKPYLYLFGETRV